MKRDLLPAAFSFMLPGLGQIYQRRLVPAALWFVPFTLLNFMGNHVRIWLPFVAIAASFEAFQAERGKEAAAKESRRIFAFSTVGMVGWVGWMAFVSPAFLPVGALIDTQDGADRIAAYVRTCRKVLRRTPERLADCPTSAEFRDPWGEAFEYRETNQGFEVVSKGRDGKRGTEDDFKFNYR